MTRLRVGGVELTAVRELALPNTHLFALAAGDAVEVARALSTRPDVRYAHPNYLLEAFRIPNDEHYALQWSLPAIDLPAAWSRTVGDARTVVAVVDSGILYDSADASRSHPDLAGRVLSGYDFISDWRVAGDGDGRDPDPYDEGDVPDGQSTYHGSHVAGIIAAATDNALGVAGVDWRASILPVRVLGLAGSGTTLDVVEGALWAAGYPIDGVPSNLNPAHVINLSLGGPGPCTPFEQDAYDWITRHSPRSAVVVVAAGNENQNAAGVTPASCRSVITVGATEARDRRAPYSNYGSRIDVMAPGGDLLSSFANPGRPDGVLSLSKVDGPGGGFGYVFQEGTSMAAPHVAGVVALMKALDPAVDLNTARAALTGSARSLSATECGRPSGAECGAGLIDAPAALTLVADGPTVPPGAGLLTLEPNPLDLGTRDGERSVVLRNDGNASLDWSILYFVAANDNPGPMPTGSVYLSEGSADSGVLVPGASSSILVGVDRSYLSVPGWYRFDIVFEVDGREVNLAVRSTLLPSGEPELSGPTYVLAFIEEGRDGFVLSGFQERPSFQSTYSMAVLPGRNVVIAWVDENRNDVIDDGDFLGVYPYYVDVPAHGRAGDVDVVVQRVLAIAGSGGALHGLPDGLPRGVAVSALREALERSVLNETAPTP